MTSHPPTDTATRGKRGSKRLVGWLALMGMVSWTSSCVIDIDAGTSEPVPPTTVGAAGSGGAGGSAGVPVISPPPPPPSAGAGGVVVVDPPASPDASVAGGRPDASIPDASDAAAPGPSCTPPILGDIEGSCITLGMTVDGIRFDCNPVQNANCPDDHVCAMHRNVFECRSRRNGPYEQQLCQPCVDQKSCDKGLTCSAEHGNQCLKLCCDDADCAAGAECVKDALAELPKLGLCLQK